MRTNYKRWVIVTLLIPLVIITCVGGFNYYIDPLWTFSHVNKLNTSQDSFNERQQKTNIVTYREFDYDTLLLGSSRTTYINQHDFMGLDTFNYALSSMSIQEYNDYIEYAKKENKKEFEYIFIGLDFYATNKNREMIEDPQIYINKANEFMYRFKNLISVDLLKQSIENAKSSSAEDQYFTRSYNRENVATAKVAEGEEVKKEIEKTVESYRESVYGPGYEYNDDIKKIFTELKENNPNTTFIVYTTPVTSQLFNLLYEENRLQDYNQWISDTVEVFGSVYNFMYTNSITSDSSNYYDGHHFYPDVGTLIAHKIINHENKDIPEDFGVLVTDDNLSEHLNFVERTLTEP
ncbi:hypothetical protein CR203_06545 [Salipaludibacillus neizhouensis]|uniref:Uncharacterized protein n=1 Tax=Salipaludibacillus neizhouensis TaxID=885475 RepID=A0A3A9K7D7_9BACI|nr:hypothetical protein [Salipaludibacillus neizhouensis]RKL68139.1 hypothetical protein CR203_06545 [Salipaludibacillus neizhouensis]